MIVSARTIFSPSRRAMRWMIPWVAGCEGPIEIVCVSKFPALSSVSFAHSGTRRSSSAIEPALAGGVVLAERVADEGVVAEDAVQVRVAREVEAVEVVGLALEPVGRRPDALDARQRRLLVVREHHADARVLVARERVEVDDRLEAAGTIRSPAPQVVDAAEIQEEVVLAARVVAQEARQGQPVLGPDLDRRHVEIHDARAPGDRRRFDALRQLLRRGRQSGRLDDAGAQASCSAAKRAERESRDFSPDCDLLLELEDARRSAPRASAGSPGRRRPRG